MFLYDKLFKLSFPQRLRNQSQKYPDLIEVEVEVSGFDRNVYLCTLMAAAKCCITEQSHLNGEF